GPAQLFQSLLAQNFVERFAVGEKQISEFERNHDMIGDEGGPKASSQAEKEHPAASVAADRLHRRVIDDPRWLFQTLGVFEARPSFAQRFGVHGRLAIQSWARIADRYRIILPVIGQRERALDQLLRRELFSRGE